MFDLESPGPLDLSPLEITEVEHAELRLHLFRPLHLQPRLGAENPHFLTAEDSRLGLDAFARTVSELVEEVAESFGRRLAELRQGCRRGLVSKGDRVEAQSALRNARSAGWRLGQKEVSSRLC